MTFVCTTCGNEPTAGATFCRHCGTPLSYGASGTPGYNPLMQQSQPNPYANQQQSYPGYAPSYPPQQYYPNQMYMMPMGPQASPFAANPPVNPFMRWLAYFLDALPLGLIHLIGIIPIVGNIIGGLLGILYMLFRDAMGASIGKQIVGNAIVTTSGTVPTTKDLVTRNVTLALPYLFLMIPFVGPIICLIVGIPVFLTEHILALATGLRIGDRLAGTRVVEKTLRG